MRQSLKNVCRLIDTVDKPVSPEQDFLSDLKRSIEMDADKWTRPPSKTYKPSGMNCMRANYYQIIGIEPDVGQSNYSVVGICNSGSDIHVRIQTAVMAMKNNGMDCEWVSIEDYIKIHHLDELKIVSHTDTETKLYHTGLNMSFMCDGIIKYKNHYYILELKTENSYKFMNRNEVDPSHYNQAIAYSLAFGIDQVLFVYISRDVLDMKAFLFNVDNTMRKGLFDYIKTCNGYIERQVVPPKQTTSKKACSYCGYKTQCRKDT